MKKIALSVLVFFAVLGFAEVQFPVEGEVVSPSGADVSWLSVRLRNEASADYPLTAPVSHDGTFTFHDVPPGSYTLLVLDTHGDEITRQMISVMAVGPRITVKLPEPAASRPTGETVSVAHLMHRPPKQALRAAVKAQKFSQAGAHDRAAVQLEQAVALDPQFADALNNLGVQYVKLHRLADAAAAFRRAVALDAASAQAQTNLAVALAMSGQLDEAESWARGAVRLDPSNAVGKSVLASIVRAKSTLRGDAGHFDSARDGAK